MSEWVVLALFKSDPYQEPIIRMHRHPTSVPAVSSHCVTRDFASLHGIRNLIFRTEFLVV